MASRQGPLRLHTYLSQDYTSHTAMQWKQEERHHEEIFSQNESESDEGILCGGMSREHSASANSRWKRLRLWLFIERVCVWIRVPWAEFCVGHFVWWNGRWSIWMYSWIDWRAPCAAQGPWNSPKVRRHAIQSIYKHFSFPRTTEVVKETLDTL